MKEFFLFLWMVASLVHSAPLYGEDGGYQGFASYVPLKNSLSRTGHSEDSIKASAGSPEISRRPSKHKDSSAYVPNSLPKKYNVLDYIPSHQHGYGGNKLSEELSPAPYHKATIYGQNDGGYKIADAFQTEDAGSKDSKQNGYSDEDYSNPQPYEYGYDLKDEHGNSQHKHETSDGHGNVKGAYGFVDEHGLYRSVEYVAGKDGFKAIVKTNEPGTENQNPADVKFEAESSPEISSEDNENEKSGDLGRY